MGLKPGSSVIRSPRRRTLCCNVDQTSTLPEQAAPPGSGREIGGVKTNGGLESRENKELPNLRVEVEGAVMIVFTSMGLQNVPFLCGDVRGVIRLRLNCSVRFVELFMT